MASNYEVWLYRGESSTRLMLLNDWVQEFEYYKVVNNVGPFAIRLSSSFPQGVIKRDHRIGFWRRDGARNLDYIGIVTHPGRIQSATSPMTRVIRGQSMELFLKRKIVAYASGTDEAEKSGAIDDMMKAYVRENVGSSAPGLRALASTLFQVSGDTTLGPVIETKAFSNKNLLDTLRELADIARTSGTEIYFNIVPITEKLTEFRTYIGQPGINRSSTGAQPLTVGIEYGNMVDSEYDEDYDSEINAWYVGGAGQGSNRVRAVATTTLASTRPFSRIEGFRDARNEGGDFNAVFEIAEAQVAASRPILRFTGTVNSNVNARYNRDWFHGDRVRATFDGLQFDCLVRMVRVHVGANGFETIQTDLESYSTASS